MTIKEAVAKRKKLSHRVRRFQARRHRLKGIEDWAKKHGFGKVERAAHGAAKNLTDKIHDLHARLRALDAWIDKHHHAGSQTAAACVKWELDQVGVHEGTDAQKRWAAELGYSWTLPWCSIFQAYALKHHGFDGRLPANPAYSGNWLTWSHGTRVTYGSARPGDLLVFDWRDGGITDHVAMYAGNGMKIGGNENDRVEHDAVPVGNVVGVVRPNW